MNRPTGRDILNSDWIAHCPVAIVSISDANVSKRAADTAYWLPEVIREWRNDLVPVHESALSIMARLSK
jgi:hypothetical protein